MKINMLLLYLTFSSLSSLSQGTSDRSNPGNLAEKTYRLLPREAAESLVLPFSKIKVIDARFDTSKIGFAVTRESMIKKLNFETGLASNLESFLQSSTTLNTADSLSLLIVVKKFWISSFGKYKNQKFKTTIPDREMNLHAKWEFYLYKGDEYLPFRRIDTVIENKQFVWKLFNDERNKMAGEENIYSILRHFLSQFNYKGAIKAFNDRNKKSMNEIMDGINARFEFPLLQYDKIKKGVYLSFEEFKQNRPSITAFNENTVKTSISRRDVQLTHPDGSAIPNYFVYNNGMYTMAGGNNGEILFKNGNSFEFFLRTRAATPRSQGDMVFGNQSTFLTPFQIDLETGSFY